MDRVAIPGTGDFRKLMWLPANWTLPTCRTALSTAKVAKDSSLKVPTRSPLLIEATA